ncbi:energy transducer TonB [Flavobacterium artemisiae]|uniref:Energy transducer TonB n=1 Tax=Flavobacterium artemisiae TaxID=2126556 RepID=A0ABW4HDG9_9FLAO
MQKKLLTIFSLFICFISFEIKAQTKTFPTSKDYKEMSELDELPTFPGGINEFYKFIGANYQTPKVQGLAGKVYATFIVEKDGSLGEIRVLKDIGYGTGTEAIRVLQISPKWIPGKSKGETVRVLYSLPINIVATGPLEEIYSLNEVFEKPAYPGGLQNFYKEVSKHFKSPEKEGLKGELVIGFIIQKDGSIGDTRILKDIGYGTGEEAIRCLKLLKKWSPGKLKDGTAVNTAYSLPFTIQSKN